MSSLKLKLGFSNGVSVGKLGFPGSAGVSDTTAPSVTGFAATTPATSTTVSITTFTADADAAAFLITESSTPPLAGAAGWGASAPTTFVVSGSTGAYTLYPWVKDAAGNVSSAYGSPITVTVIVALAWYDFSTVTGLYQTNDTSTPVTADGQTIGYATDKSGSGYHLTEATAGKRPLYKTNIQNSKSVARFDGGDATNGDVLSNASPILTQPLYIFIVMIPGVISGQDNMVDGTQGGNRCVVFWANGTAFYSLFAGAALASASAAVQGNADLITALFNGASSVLRKDSAQIASGNAGTTGNDKIFLSGDSAGANKYAGDIGELIYVVGSISTGARDAVEAYLNAKWAIF